MYYLNEAVKLQAIRKRKEKNPKLKYNLNMVNTMHKYFDFIICASDRVLNKCQNVIPWPFYLPINVSNVANLAVTYTNMVRKLRCCCSSNEWDKWN